MHILGIFLLFLGMGGGVGLVKQQKRRHTGITVNHLYFYFIRCTVVHEVFRLLWTSSHACIYGTYSLR